MLRVANVSEAGKAFIQQFDIRFQQSIYWHTLQSLLLHF